MDSYMALFEAVRIQRESAQDSLWASDLTNTEICLHEFLPQVEEVFNQRLRRINRKPMRDGVSVAAASVDLRLPVLFHIGEPVKNLELKNISGYLHRNQVRSMLADAGVHTCDLTYFRPKPHSTAVKVACPSLTSSCRLQLATMLKRVLWTRYSSTLHESESHAVVRPILQTGQRAAAVPTSELVDPESLLSRVVSNVDLIEYLSEMLSYDDLSNAWLLCKNLNLVRLLMRRRVDSAWPGFVGQNARQMIKDYIYRFQPKEVVLSEQDIIRDAAVAFTVLDSPSGQLPFSLHLLDLTGVRINSQIISLISESYTVVELKIAEASNTLSTSFSRIRPRQLRVDDNSHLRSEFLSESKSTLEVLLLNRCREVAFRPIINMLRDNLILRELYIYDCTFLINNQTEAMLLLLEAIVNEDTYVEKLTIAFSNVTVEQPFDSQFINLTNNLTLEEINFSNNTHIAKFLPLIIINVQNIKTLDLSKVPLLDYLDFTEMWALKSLKVCYSRYVVSSLSTILADSFKYLFVINNLGKKKSKFVDLNSVEHLTHADKFLFSFYKCKIVIPALLEQRIKNNQISLVRDELNITLARDQ
uniref:F-box domain-containing protein n=1 Tax=Trichogramma kaykai TaxID=54128 RepID=A0ABD2WUH8_9HYME